MKKPRKAVIHFEEFSDKQIKVLTWWTDNSPYKDMRGIVADGAIRSGKTLTMSISYGLWAMNNFDRAQFGMAGKSILSFRRNVLGSFKQVMETRGYRIKEKRSENMFIMSKDGVENYFFLFGGKDERSQDLVQGITLNGFFFDEAALMPYSFVNQALGRLSKDNSKFWFNCNPEGPFHWFKTEFIDDKENKKILRIPFEIYDNPSLSEERIDYFENMFKGVFFERFIKGRWVRSEGIIYDNFNRETMVVDRREPRIFDQSYISIDYGTQNATVFKLWRREKDTGKWFCTKEYYYSGRDQKVQLSDQDYADQLDKFAEEIYLYKEFNHLTKTYDIKEDKFNSLKIILDPSAASFRVELKDRGYDVIKAKNDVLDGIRVQATLMNNGTIQWYDNNVHTFAELESYSWDETAAKRGDEKPLKEMDHCCDADRYFCYTILRKNVGGVSILGSK